MEGCVKKHKEDTNRHDVPPINVVTREMLDQYKHCDEDLSKYEGDLNKMIITSLKCTGYSYEHIKDGCPDINHTSHI